MTSSRAHSESDVAHTAPRAVLLHVLRGTLALSALIFTCTYLGCAALRVSYPWEVEWMEGGMIVHAARVLRGLPIYAQPSLEFIAYFYTPLYAYVLAALSYVTGGLSFALGRGVSIAASLATMGMLLYAARRERGWLAGVLAVGLYAAMFRVSGAFYDLARVDSLSLALLLAAGLVAHYKPTLRGSVLAAALSVLAIFAKQTSAVVCVFIGCALLLRNLRNSRVGLAYAAVGGVLSLLGALYFEHSSQGWFSFYIWRGHQGHAFQTRGVLLSYWRDLVCLSPFVLLVPTLGASYGRFTRWLAVPLALFWMFAWGDRVQLWSARLNEHYSALWYASSRAALIATPLCLALLLGAARWLTRGQGLRAPDSFFLWLWAGGAIASALNYATQWAYSNCFMPVAVFASLYSALTLAELLQLRCADSVRGTAAAALCACAMLSQLFALSYDPRDQVPSAEDRAAVRDVLAKLDTLAAPVLMPAHPLYGYLRDGTICAHSMGFRDVSQAGGVQDVEARLASGEFRSVVIDTNGRRPGALKHHYQRVDKLEFKGRALYPMTGYKVRPEYVFVYTSK